MTLISLHIASENDIPVLLLLLLFIEHILAMLFFRWYVISNLDWVRYYNMGKLYAEKDSSFDYVKPGQDFIIGINHLLQSLGPFSILEMFFVFALFGFLGHVFFLAACRPFLTLPRDVLWLGLFFLPGLHVLSSAIGKDSLIFLPLSYVLYTFSRARYPVIPLCIAGATLFMIRPHVMFFFIAAGFLASIFSRGSEGFYLKAGMIVATTVVLLITVSIVRGYVGMKELSFESATETMEDHALNYQTGDGAVELNRLSPPARLATFMFRPLFFDVRNKMGLIASFENAILLAMFGLFTYQGLIPWLISRPSFSVLFAVSFVLLMWLALGMTCANLGLALRQKTQFLPYLFYVFLVFRWSRENENQEILNYQ